MSGTTAGRNKTQDTKTRSTVFAGDLMLGQGNQIEQKKQTARRQAMKLITDAWGRDELASQSIKDMEQQKADYVEQMQEAKEHEKTFEKSKKGLQEQYGVADDSQEQKDLELLEKFQNYKNGSHDESFTKEDVDRLKELQNLPRTEYQEKALRLNQIAGSMKVTASNAKDKLIEQKQSGVVKAYQVDETKDKMVAGEAALALMWSGDAQYAIDLNDHLDYFVPTEGSNIWVDGAVILKSARNKENAEKFINFLCRPDIAQMNCEYIWYSSPNKGAIELMGEEYENNHVLNPSQEVQDRCEFFHDIDDTFRKIYENLWMEIKNTK